MRFCQLLEKSCTDQVPKIFMFIYFSYFIKLHHLSVYLLVLPFHNCLNVVHQVYFGMLDAHLAEEKIPDEYSGQTQVDTVLSFLMNLKYDPRLLFTS